MVHSRKSKLLSKILADIIENVFRYQRKCIPEYCPAMPHKIQYKNAHLHSSLHLSPSKRRICESRWKSPGPSSRSRTAMAFRSRSRWHRRHPSGFPTVSRIQARLHVPRHQSCTRRRPSLLARRRYRYDCTSPPIVHSFLSFVL